MTQFIQTLNNYSLRPLASALLDPLVQLGNRFIEAQEKRGLNRVIAELRKYRSYRQTYDELMALTDKELNDIGISRGMIHSIALEAYTDNLLNK